MKAIEAIVGHAAELTRRSRLLPPAEAVFVGEHEVEVSQLEAVRGLATTLLQAVVDTGTLPAAGTRDEDRKTAVYYAAALLKQERALAALASARSEAPELDGAVSGMDRKRVEDLLLNRSMIGPVSTLARLVTIWGRLVSAAESHRKVGWEDEYEQGLIARDYLEDAVSVLAPAAREGLERHLRPLDKRFADQTRSLTTSIRPPAVWQPQRWWWFRVPQVMDESFRERLSSAAPAAAREALGDAD